MGSNLTKDNICPPKKPREGTYKLWTINEKLTGLQFPAHSHPKGAHT